MPFEADESIDLTLQRVAYEAAIIGGRISLDMFANRKDLADDIHMKDGHFDIVTAADPMVEEAVTQHLFANVSDSRILGEEGGWRGSGAITWMVDPIDGTSNYASGLPIFATSVAAINGSRPVAAAVYQPVIKTVFHKRNGELFVNDAPFHWDPKHRSAKDVELLTNAPYERYGLPDGMVEDYRRILGSFRAVRRLGACTLHVAYVAAGLAAACYEYDFHPWDIAAGLQLAEASGCCIQSWDEKCSRVSNPAANPERIRILLVTAPGLEIENIEWTTPHRVLVAKQ
ncbi:hypothetical protein M3T53_02355 [Actinomyces sp. B33]|uniref:inositol monophosphatase family protein n=1 Tax=Actinomyces sp. B33 TaxID=2942131 RepID=UPI00234020EF|nr:inositol monophosphatase family protein [Actinomyces sp. B33]MDC4232557.1 hypothetical protein [Actinomyces sp. B33]